MRLCLLSCHNQYASKRYFTQKFADALMRQGIDTHILAWPDGPFPEELVKKVEELKPTLTASFHQLPEQTDGKYFWDGLNIPHWSILLDPVFYDLELMRSPLSIISCVDQGDCELLSSYHFERQFFFPHAVEKELIAPPQKERPIDVIFLGTCYDPDHLYDYWKTNYSKEILCVLEEAVTIVLTESKTTFVRALLQALITNGIDPKEVEFDSLAQHVDSYSRGIDRVNLIRSITEVAVHVYGGKSWREDQPTKDWCYYLAKQPNVTVHPPVNFAEGLELLKKSKICLNSMPFFKKGTHERIFCSLACGALPVSTENEYLKEIFANDEIMFYQSDSLEGLNDRVQKILSRPDQLVEKIAKGQAIVLQSHTWDKRAELFLEKIQFIV